ncbi:cyclin-dependent kinase inhibitor 4-like isoform X2 [Impatiens glandulifera]|uniref:cyclin-dependent kinase inhibitor 4-like isoform X2 n=1 Tax=Impatiens glandulifera TaxID=253017 RepID=UPI001FB1688A|nr:cyclin-dependent kinase inhibitor 4-like isoform X2 [Impatiens glandulifera]
MGKEEVINKSKAEAAAAGEEEVSIGVRTRAKTQALQEGLLHHNSAAPAAAGDGSYLQLRSRRLQRPLNFPCQTKRNPIPRLSKSTPPTPHDSRTTTTTTSNSKVIGSINSRAIGTTASFNCLGIQSEISKAEGGAEEERNINLHVGPVEASSSSSFGDEECTTRLIRRSRESTPSSSSSASSAAAETARRRRRRRKRSRLMPTSNEMDRFFLGHEQQQQTQFMEKYNFDPVNDKPLPGRFEWKKLDPK